MDNKDKSSKGSQENTVQRLDKLTQHQGPESPEKVPSPADVLSEAKEMPPEQQESAAESTSPDTSPDSDKVTATKKSAGSGKKSKNKSNAKSGKTAASPTAKPSVNRPAKEQEPTVTTATSTQEKKPQSVPETTADTTTPETTTPSVEEAPAKQPRAADVPPVETPPPSSQKSGGRWLGVLAILLVLILAVVGYMVWLKLQQQIAGSSDNQEQYHQELVQLTESQQSRYQQLVNELGNSRAKATKLEQTLSQQGRTVTMLTEKLSQLSGRRPNDWLLAEASYLVELAGRKLWMERDQRTALSLLATADSRISEMHEANLVPLRQAFARDIAALQALPADKSESLALRLDGLISQVDNLKLNMVVQTELVDAEDANALSESVDDWRTNLHKSWLAIRDSFFTVRSHSGGVEPLLAPQQQWYLEENLKTKLLQAQLAIYREQQEAYEHAIDQISLWLMQFYDRQHSTTEFMLRELAELQQAKIVHQYPNEFETTDLLQLIIQQRGNSLPQPMEPSS